MHVNKVVTDWGDVSLIELEYDVKEDLSSIKVRCMFFLLV